MHISVVLKITQYFLWKQETKYPNVVIKTWRKNNKLIYLAKSSLEVHALSEAFESMHNYSAKHAEFNSV